MFYRVAKIVMWVTLRFFFRKVRVDGAEKLAHRNPAILIANHTASFLDAMVLSVFLRRPLFFFVRGDIFKHPIALYIFTKLHMVPIFSSDDGRSALSKNKSTFDRGQDILKNDKLLLIFPEGYSRLSKDLSPFKKGTARVALQTAFDFGIEKEFTIETVYINYSFHGFRSDLVIRIGDSLSLAKYKEEYSESPGHAITNLTRDMFALFEKNVLYVAQPERTLYVESLLRMLFSDVQYKANDFFISGRKVCQHVSALSEQEFVKLSDQLIACQVMLKQYQIMEQVISSKKRYPVLRIFILLITFPFSLIGFGLWHAHFKLTKWISDKTVTRDDFYTSVFSGIWGVVGIIWWLLLCSIGYYFKAKLIFILFFFSPIFYYGCLLWREQFKVLLSEYRFYFLSKSQPEVYHAIVSSRNNIKTWH
ncbi:MAG: hypothetical protein CK547_00515 [Chitinophagaceae bacterium]|nr:MAG: hypothetical protein CK547_00515 [Chitinophagaceae bacterium]